METKGLKGRTEVRVLVKVTTYGTMKKIQSVGMVKGEAVPPDEVLKGMADNVVDYFCQNMQAVADQKAVGERLMEELGEEEEGGNPFQGTN